MTSETRQAFDHPEARSRATGDGPLDRISLRDHVISADIGAFQQERGRQQRLCFNVVVEVRPPETRIDDDVDLILSYDTITEAIAHELQAERLNLLETLAERVAERILLAPLAQRVFVRVEKLDRGPGALGVEIVRARVATPDVTAADDRPHPLVVHLSNAAIGSDHLTGWLDQLQAAGRPVVLTVGLPGTASPRSAVAPAQRRINLLAVEQNAWVIAGRDRRCVVVETRTEIDWAMKHGHIVVWAPSKIVLDAVAHPAPDLADPAALALWFAQEMQAESLILIGEQTAIPQPGLPVRSLAVTEPQLL